MSLESDRWENRAAKNGTLPKVTFPSKGLSSGDWGAWVLEPRVRMFSLHFPSRLETDAQMSREGWRQRHRRPEKSSVVGADYVSILSSSPWALWPRPLDFHSVAVNLGRRRGWVLIRFLLWAPGAVSGAPLPLGASCGHSSTYLHDFYYLRPSLFLPPNTSSSMDSPEVSLNHLGSETRYEQTQNGKSSLSYYLSRFNGTEQQVKMVQSGCSFVGRDQDSQSRDVPRPVDGFCGEAEWVCVGVVWPRAHMCERSHMHTHTCMHTHSGICTHIQR